MLIKKNICSSSPRKSSKTDSNVIVEKTEGGVLSFQNRILETVLTVPNPIPNSNGLWCNVITISYELKVEVWTGSCRFNIVLTSPIVIGSDPLIMNSSSVQPTFGGQLVRPPVDFHPVQPYTDESLHQNNVSAPPGYAASYRHSTAPQDQRERKLLNSEYLFQYLDFSSNIRRSSGTSR